MSPNTCLKELVFNRFFVSSYSPLDLPPRPANWWRPRAAGLRYLAEIWTTWRSTAAASRTACWGCWAAGGGPWSGWCRTRRTPSPARYSPGCRQSGGRDAPRGCPGCKTWRSETDCRWTWPSGTGTSWTGSCPELSRPRNASASGL